MTRWLVVIGAAVTLCGCQGLRESSPNFFPEDAARAAQRRSAIAAASDDQTCLSYGAKPGSDAYVQCRMQRDTDRQRNAAALAPLLMPRQAVTTTCSGGYGSATCVTQ